MKVTISRMETNGTHDKAHMWVDGALCAVVMLRAGEFDKFVETIWNGKYEFNGLQDVRIETE